MTLHANESWVRDATFLCRLERDQQDRLLAAARREEQGARMPLIKGQTAVLLLSGEVEVANGLLPGTRRGAPGRLFGAGALLRDREPRVSASTPVELLRWHAEDLSVGALGWELSELLHSLADLEYQLELLDEVLRQEPTLRALPPPWREQLLQCSTVRDCTPGEVLLESGKRNPALVLLLRGTARLTTAATGALPQRTGQLIPAGTLLGAQDFEAEQPPVQPYRIDAPAGGRVLCIPWTALAHLFRMVRAAQPRAMAQSRDARRGRVHLLHSVSPNLGTTSLAVGAAVALTEHHARAAVLDLSGAATTKRMKLAAEPRTLGGIRCGAAPLGSPQTELWWPERPEDTESLLLELQLRQQHILVSHPHAHQLPKALLDRVTTLIHVYDQDNDRCDAPLAQHQRMIHVLRLPKGGFPAARTRPGRRPSDDVPSPPRDQILRLPWDATVPEVAQGLRAIRQLGTDETAFGRASGRLARMLMGKATGLALGGGGAWGFAHVGLLRALHDAHFPVDYVAGASFGAVVGAVYVGGGLDALSRLERSMKLAPLLLGGCVLSTAPLGLFIDHLVGPIHQMSTEIPLLAVAADVRTAAPYLLPTGTLADAVRASSGFPGLFASYRYGGRRLVDGGVAANVPAEAVHVAGADFILASNVIPRSLFDDAPIADAPLLGRAMDLVRSTLALMHRSSARDAALADHVFNARVGDYTAADFLAAEHIAELAYEQAMSELGAIRAAYDADLSTHLTEL